MKRADCTEPLKQLYITRVLKLVLVISFYYGSSMFSKSHNDYIKYNIIIQ